MIAVQSVCVCVSLLACLCRAQRAWRRCVPGHVSWSGMQPGPCNMTRRQPRLRFLDKTVSGPLGAVSNEVGRSNGRRASWGQKVPHATIRGPWTSNRTSKLEAGHSTRGTPRLESVVLGFCCINWPFRHSTWRHQMTPMDPLFPRSAKRGRRRGSPALLTLMMMAGLHTFTAARPRRPSGYRPSIQNPESRHVQPTHERGF